MSRSNSTSLPSTFWTLIEVLRNPQLHKHLAATINQNYSPQSREYDVKRITDTPLMQSLQAEIRRLRVSTVTTRTSEIDTVQLDEQWMLPKDITVLLFSQDISLHRGLWAKARPGSVSRPLSEFWAERFLISNRAKSSLKSERKQTKDNIETGSFSMEALEPLDLVFDSVDHLGLGRDYLGAVQAATLAVFLTEFELQLCDPEAVDGAVPPVGEVAFGMGEPLEKVAVRIRQRKIG